ncbi:MAG: PspC domain-containing protein [Bacteroidaceae bacterium]|nr:PspC domain-containing protein [Bacteroidaceae bacterium]
MKKINNIHIGGRAFYFEEEASNIMEQYLARIKELYRDNGEELKVADVEQRIAEFCTARVGENGIVNAVLIEEAIKSIGIEIETPTAQPAETTEQPTNEAEAEEPRDHSNEPWYRAMLLGSKIFRNPHDSYIGGVLAGLAAYFGISTALLRIITVILFIVEPTGILYFVYIALWIIFPKAKSIMDYTRMRRVGAKGDKESMEAAWKSNYERTMAELAQPPASGCLPMLLKILFFLPLVPLAVALCILAIFIIVIPIGFMYIFAIGGTATLFTVPLAVMAISLVTAIAVMAFALIHWILNRMNVCKPMNKWPKIILATLLIVSLLFAGIGAYRVSKSCDSYENLWQKVENEFSKFIDGGFLKHLTLGKVTMKSGQFYNEFPIDESGKKVFGAIWDKELQNCNIPFVVETTHNDRGEYNIYFYRHQGSVMEIKHKVAYKEYDACYTVNAEELNGYIYFIWDNANNTLYSDEIYETPTDSRSTTFEKRTNAVKIDAISHDGTFNFGNAAEKGLTPFSLFFYGNQRIPSLLVGGDGNQGLEIAPSSTYKHLKDVKLNGNEEEETDYPTAKSHINIDEDKLNKAIDDVMKLGQRAESIINYAHGIVDISNAK